MKIAIFHELHEGGALRAVAEFAKRLSKGNTVDIYTTDSFVAKKWIPGDWMARLYKDTIELFKLFLLHRRMAIEIDNKNYDVVFAHPSKYTQTPFILRFLKTPSVYYCEEVLRLIYDPVVARQNNITLFKRIYEIMVRMFRKTIDRQNIRAAGVVLANSKFTQGNIKRAYGIESQVQYLGTDTEFFKSTKVKKDIDVLYIGAKDEVDGYYLLRKACARFKKKLVVKYFIMLKKWISDTELRSLYRRSKVVACLAKNEPLGLIPLEASSCEVPVIALAQGGYIETVVDGKGGFLVPPKPEKIAEKIRWLLANPKRREKMGKFARDHVITHFTWKRSAEAIEKDLLRVSESSESRPREKKFKLLSLLLFIFTFSLFLRLITINQIGRTWDEFLYVEQGYKMTELFRKGDFDNEYFYTTYDHPPLVKYLYGIPAHFDASSKLENDEAVFNYDLTYSRTLSAIMFSLGVVALVALSWKIFSPIIAVTSGVILSMLPFSLGLSQLVTTESLKILIYPLVILSFINLVKRFSVKNIILSGVLTGIALQTKQSNFLLVLILALTFFLQYKFIEPAMKSGFIKARAVALLTIIIIGIVVFILIWPQMIFHFKEVYEINNRLWSVQFSPKPWLITLSPPEVFFGRLMLTPNFYYIVYFLITIPALILALFMMGAIRIIKARNLYFYLILLWFLVPFVLSFYSWRQHGLRYIIEIYPPIAIIAAFGFDTLASKLAKSVRHKLLLLLPVILYLGFTLYQIRPYYLDYFNEFVGGVGTVQKNNWFQTGWWGQGMREAGLYLKENAEDGSKIGLALSPEHTFPKLNKHKYFEWSEKSKYDYVVVNHYHIIRDGFDDSQIKRDYRLTYEVKADGATLVYVYEKE